MEDEREGNVCVDREILSLDWVGLGEIEVYVFSFLNFISVWCLIN